MESFELFVGETRIKIFVSGPDDILTRIQNQQDIKKYPRLVGSLCGVYKEANVYRIDAPNFGVISLELIESTQLTPIQLGGVFILGRDQWIGAGGLWLDNIGAMLGMSGAGCAVGIMTGGGFVLILHVSMENLVDCGALYGRQTREYVSIIDKAVAEFRKRGVSLEEIAVSIQLAMPTIEYRRQFKHKKFGPYNQAFYKVVNNKWPDGVRRNGNGAFFINLEGLCEDQVYDNGIRNFSIGHSLNNFPDLTYTYDNKKNPVDSDGRELPRRNFIGAKRLS
jgi:hypothetical protein